MLAQWPQIALLVVQVIDRIAIPSRGVHDREIEDFVRRVETHEQIKDLVNRPMRAGGRLVNLIDHDNNRQVQREGFLEHKKRLRHRAFLGIDQQQCAISHFQDAFDLAAEIGVSGRVDNIDTEVLIIECAIFCGDGDAALALQFIRVHQALRHFLVVTEHTAKFEQLVNQRGFAVVNVSDDGDVPDLILFHKCLQSYLLKTLA